MNLRFKKRYRLTAAAICLLMLCTSALAARTGSLRVEVEDAEWNMTVTLYHVASKDGTLTPAFAGSGLSRDQLLKETERAASSAALAAFVSAKGLAGTSLTTNSNGEVLFEALNEGVYLVCGEGSTMVFDPFLVTIPTKIGLLTIYDVKATPKAEPLEPTPSFPPVTPTPTDPPVTPSPDDPEVTPPPSDPPATPTPNDPPVTPTPDVPDEPPDIPQTGVNVWPIYLLLGLGILFVAAGLLVLRRGRKEEYE